MFGRLTFREMTDPRMNFNLDRDVIVETPAEDLAQRACDMVAKVMLPTRDRDVPLLPLPWRAAYTASFLEAECSCSGFYEALVHHAGYYQMMEEDLRLLGADPYVMLYAEARAIMHRAGVEYAEDINSDSDEYREIQTLDDRMSKEDERKSLRSYVGEYIKAHPEQFTA
jgi:hypothetical protein